MKNRILSVLLTLAMVFSCVPGTALAAQDGNELVMRYDDHLDVSGRGAAIVDAGKPTSHKVGYGIEANTVKDDTVLSLSADGNTLIATGVGTAQVTLDDETYDVTVTPAPISLFLLMGQSNMEGAEGEEKQSIVCPDGQVYASFGPHSMSASTAANYAPSALTGEKRDINVNGTGIGNPVYMLNESGNGKSGMDSGIAYEWAKYSGEKVWLVNAAHNGSKIETWQKGKANFNEAVNLFSACQETLQKEITAGHFTLSHMGYFWCQGCGDDWMTAQQYTENYLAMHKALKEALAIDMDGDGEKETLEFGNIITTLAGHEAMLGDAGRGGYRFGGQESQVPGFYSTYKELEMRGQRVSQRWMAANEPDINMVCTLGEEWLTMPDGTDGVQEFFESRYPGGIVDYPVQVRQKAEWYRPTKATDVKDTVHYNQIGYNEVGREAARNTMILLPGYLEDTDQPTTVEFKDWSGNATVTNVEASPSEHSGTLVVPVVTPCYRAKSVTYQTTDGLSYDYYDLLTKDYNTTGTLTAVAADSGKTLAQVSVGANDTAGYRWDMEPEGHLANSTDAAKYPKLREGMVDRKQFSAAVYGLGQVMQLRHDKSWALEWKMSGTWGSAVKLFSDTWVKNVTGSVSIMINGSNLSFAQYNGSTHQKYGLDLTNIDLTQSHTFRLVNSVDNGSNTVYLFVDGTESGTMEGASGMDFAFDYLGAVGYELNNCIIDYIEVLEDGADETTHFHTFDSWTNGIVPTASTRGTRTGVCTGCGQTVTRDVLGSWKLFYVEDHLQTLPETVYKQTNLCDALPDVLGCYKYNDTNTTKDGLSWSSTEQSVTFAIKPGEKIYSTSFAAKASNGGDEDGCWVSFWSPYGISQVLTPAETYAEFAENNGYITAPDNAVLVNVALWDMNTTAKPTANDKFIVQLVGREEEGYTPEAGDVFFIPGRALAGCISEGYVVASKNPKVTVGELVPVIIPADCTDANNGYGKTQSHFWECLAVEDENGEVTGTTFSLVTGMWYSTTKNKYGYHDTITGLTDTTLNIKHADGHTGTGDKCGYNFEASCGGSSTTRNNECAGTLTRPSNLPIIDLTGNNAKTLEEVETLTDAGRAVINTYSADGQKSGGTATVIVVVPPSTAFVPTYNVTVVPAENGGTVTVDTTSGTIGTVTATADYGYVLGSILVDGVDVTAEAENGKYIFLIEKDHQVTATFTALPRYTVETTTNGNGTVTLDRDWYVSGGTVTVTLMPKGNYTLLDAQPVDEDTTAIIGAAASGDSYELTKLLVNGEDVTNEVEGNKHTFTIEEDTQIQAEFEKKAAEEVKIVNENMILGNSLSMNFYVLRNSIDPDKDYYIQVTKTYADDRDAVVQRYDEELWQKHNEDGYEYYRVTFDGLAAKEMNDDIMVQVFYADGTEAGPVHTSSPRLYAEKALGYSALSGWWTMFVDMLNYGASAQQHFGYDVEHLANAGLTEAQKAMASGEVTLDTVDRNGGANGYFYGSTLYLEHNIALNLYLSKMSAGMYIQVSFTDHSGTEQTRTVTFEEMLENTVEGVVYHVVSVNELAVADCEAAVTVEVYNADGELLDTGMDSVVTYLYKMDETHSDDPLYENALKFIASAKENV